MSSKWWSNMLFTDITDDEFALIKFKALTKIPLYPHCKMESNDLVVEEVDNLEILDFLANNNSTISGNTSLLQNSDLEKFYKLQAIQIKMRTIKSFKSLNVNQLIGYILSIPFPLSFKLNGTYLLRNLESINSHTYEDLEQYQNLYYNDDRQIRPEVYVGVCTSYLCLHPKFRDKGLAMLLIRNIINYVSERGVQIGYHMMQKSLYPSLEIEQWYRPLNLKRCKTDGFMFIPKKTPTLTRLYYKITKPNNCNIFKITSNKYLTEAYHFWKNQSLNIKTRGIFYNPNLEHFKTWINCFPSYLVIDNNSDPIGFFSYYCHSVYIKSKQKHTKVATSLLINSINSESEAHVQTLRAMLYTVNQESVPALYFYNCGILNSKILSEIHALKTNSIINLGFYNLKMPMSNSDIYIPLF